ncbi:Hypothetical predicted protein [Mytilus galloprovincialis]|nr:Hypothetical predicted protein [Mytilus galloprovincialis]
MRYSEDVKRFWRVGLKLFKGKFVRFMSGIKNKGQLDIKGKYNPSDSKINFAVPNRQVLDAMESPVDASTPGILTDMIDQISLSDPKHIQTYQLCVDGKKINSGVLGQKLGDINLWGNESSPTLCERQGELKHELNKIKLLEDIVEQLNDRDIQLLDDVLISSKLTIAETMFACISLFSTRIRDLRNIRIGQKLTLNKLLLQTTGDWRVSRLGFAISAIRSKICEIDTCILDILHVIDEFSYTSAFLQGSDTYVKASTNINLEHQPNFVCLQGIKEYDVTDSIPGNEILSVMEQKSTAWFKVREQAVLTGSTIYRALGFDGLKNQKAHFDKVFNKKTEPFDDETLKRLKHGSDNEINAIATLVTKIMPVFFPNLQFYEEGCYAFPVDGTGTLIVSPDGSLREVCIDNPNQTTKPVVGIEIKCPYHGKEHSTPVQYTLPIYYIPQVLCEMHVLKVDNLLFISYSAQSTSVLKVHFDDVMLKKLMETAIFLYPKNNEKFPTRLHPQIKHLREELKDFRKNNVEFVCEVMSMKATQCSHSSEHPNSYLRGRHNGREISCSSQILVSEMHCTVHKARTCLETAYNLSRRKATEVLVFIIANTDRFNNQETPHALPIAYALKGYSMKTDVMRKMLDQVLLECYHRGLYIPVVSFDGQWNNVAIRDNNGKPLTILQLQKDVFNQAKRETKSAILNMISRSNIVKVNDMETAKQQIDISYNKDDAGYITSPIYVGCAIGSPNKFTPSKHVIDLIVNASASKLHQEVVEPEAEGTSLSANTVEETDQEFVINTLPVDVIGCLDVDIIKNIETVQYKLHEHNQDIVTKRVTLDDLKYLFRESEDKKREEVVERMEEEHYSEEVVDSSSIEVPDTDIKTSTYTFTENDYSDMLSKLKDSKDNKRWKDCDVEVFKTKFKSVDCIKASFLKREVHTCLKAIAKTLRENSVVFALSWPKYRIVELFDLIAKQQYVCIKVSSSHKPKLSVKSLARLCQKTVSTISKPTLSAIFAEHIFPERLREWRTDNPFQDGSIISGLNDCVNWYCKPVYISESFQTLFHLLDPHHIFTNARVKCCSSGITERAISKEAWVTVAKAGNTKLSLAHVEDLVDRQSDAFAHTTFSAEVEQEMIINGFTNEATFCKLLREWYAAEDSPGVGAKDRCSYRLNLRKWLLENVRFNQFPPPGSHVRGIPLIMFEALMTNIDRRIQLFSFVKGGTYNVRSLGSLEAENFFGEFQDLDPKGCGVLRPDDIPCAIGTACELLSIRMDDKKSFFMQTSRSKIYPVHPVIDESQSDHNTMFFNPSKIQLIEPKDHFFDSSERGKRMHAKRKVSTITKYGAPCKGIKPVRQHHRCDEEKILPHKRLGIELND